MYARGRFGCVGTVVDFWGSKDLVLIGEGGVVG